MNLYNANIPYVWNAGNHDELTNATYPYSGANLPWNGSSVFALNAKNMESKSYWVSDCLDSKCTAAKFTFGRHNFLMINVEYLVNQAGVVWMINLLNTYPDYNHGFYA